MDRLSRRCAAACAVVAAFAAIATGTASAGVELSLDPTALDLARSMVATPSIVTGAAYVSKPPSGTPTAIASGELDGFPTGGAGTDFAILTTPAAAVAPPPKTPRNTRRNGGGRAPPGP